MSEVKVNWAYTYLRDLYQYNGMGKYFSAAQAQLYQADATTTNALSRKNNAAQFLYKVANNELQKEKQFFQYKLSQFQKLQSTPLPDDLKTELNKFCSELQVATTSTSINYIDFSKKLTTILTSVEEAKNRIRLLRYNITRNDGKKRGSDTMVGTVDGYLENVSRGLNEILSLLTEQESTIKSTKYASGATTGQVLYEYLNEQLTQGNIDARLLQNPPAFLGWITKILIDFNKFREKQDLDERYGDEYKRTRTTIEKRQEKVRQQFQQFLNAQEKENNGKLGITSTLSDDDIGFLSELGIDIGYYMSEGSRDTSFDFNELYQDTSGKLKSGNSTSRGHISVSATKTSSLAEVLTRFFSANMMSHAGGRTGNAGLADDVLLMMLKINDPESENPIVSQTIEYLKHSYSTYIEALQTYAARRKSGGDRSKLNKQFINKIEEIYQALDAILRENNEEAFIIHESTKYYESIEEGAGGRFYKHTGFQAGFGGRTIAILNYIDMLTSLGGELGLNEDVSYLKFAAINLANNAAGAHLKPTLATIFSYAAALIMFDDYATIAKEASEDGSLELTNLTNIHLYNLNGLYVPASYIIQQTAEALAAMEQNIHNNGVTVAINTPSKLAYEKCPTTEDIWEAVAHEAETETKVSLHFFSQFNSFIRNMNS